jgi:hypothetical protein
MVGSSCARRGKGILSRKQKDQICRARTRSTEQESRLRVIALNLSMTPGFGSNGSAIKSAAQQFN